MNVSFPAVVAVYGTLKKGFGNHRRLADAKYLSNAKVKGTMYSLGGYPALSLHGNTDVTCELYQVDDENTMRGLDQLEGYREDGKNNFYERQKVETSAGPAWIYTMDHDERLRDMPVVKSGIWE